MTITDQLVALVSAATPPADALAGAYGRLEAVDSSRSDTGEPVVDVYSGGRPSAPNTPSVMNRAWGATIAATVESEPWPAVVGTVLALRDAPSATRRARSDAAEHLGGAVAIGTAVADWVAAALRSGSADRWSHITTAGLIGAGAAAGHYLELDSTRLRNLIGLCATQAAGLATADGTESGGRQLAKSAADAVEAAALARHGFTAAADSLGGRRGLFTVFAPGGERQPDLRWSTA